ncbi:MAG: magnesium transporter [Phycisphaerales bacterium]|nr:magnesium transporter [Phycisphaerales bacterium]
MRVDFADPLATNAFSSTAPDARKEARGVNPTAELIQPEVLELVREGRFSELREALRGIPAADIADIVCDLEPSEAAVMFRFLPRDDAGEVFAYLPAEEQEELINALGASAVRVIEGMDTDDRVRLLDELPPEVAQRLIASLNPQERKEVQAILGYPAESVGRLMTPDYVRVRIDWTMAHALEHIRRHGRDAETINVVYVVDDQGRLVDDVRLRQILLADPGATVESLLTRNFVSLRADQDQEEAVRLLTRYDRTALPVVDSRGVLLGIVTHDDVADVAEEEATEDIQKLGGVAALEEPYMQATFMEMIRKRSVWLCVLFAGQLLTVTVMDGFEDALHVKFLVALIPLIISSGGNSGSQAASLVIRALALQEVGVKDWLLVLRKELLIGLVLGGLLGGLGMLRIYLWHVLGWHDYGEHYLLVGLTTGCALVAIVTWATLLGSLLPILLRRMGLDPATSSTPFIATLMDVSGLLIYFGVAILILKGTVL